MTSPLALSSHASVSAAVYGREAQPIVTVEDALGDVEQVIEIAAQHKYRPMGEFYPGIRAGVSQRIAMPLVDPLLAMLQEVFALERPPHYRECFLSVVTKRPDSLAPIQRLPHFDGLEESRLAVLLYLDKERRGGTAFYRQRATGFESVDASRYEEYREKLDGAVEEHGLPPPGYIRGDTPIFEQVHSVPDTLNSMVIYRGNSLHCAHLPQAFEPDANPASGRLTINLFLN